MRLGLVLSEVGQGLRRNLSMVVSVVLVTFISLTFVGAAMLLQMQITEMKSYWFDRAQVAVYLCTEFATIGGCEQQAATPEQIAQQCDGLGEAMKAEVDAVALSSAPEVLAKVNGFISGSGMSPDQLETTARICMSSGYQTENMRTTLSGALLMVALGQVPYAELVGHHLVTGYGTVKRPKRAGEWYDMAVSALEQGATPVVAAADQPDRPALLRAALSRMNGGAQQGGAVPVFTVAE